ncbi:hypothetical protein AAE478_008303 [Parahypoxylon ruwenzoriense]
MHIERLVYRSMPVYDFSAECSGDVNPEFSDEVQGMHSRVALQLYTTEKKDSAVILPRKMD